ncbi:MAG: NADH-quinone oxidoreductase subunit C [Geminicoccaceae bacterium]|nr:NADH-quinone oxidoreductase subunit C [Geminicoccaceae bacterium]
MTIAVGPEVTENLEDLLSLIEPRLGEDLVAHGISRGELTITVPASAIVRVLAWLRDEPNMLMKELVDLCGVDYPERDQRFEVVYHLLSMHHNMRMRVKVLTDEMTPVPSITGVHRSAGWFEREAWDMYGILFSDHPDLRRLLTDYGFDGHPLRKDFPLTGHVELRYDPEQARVVYEPVQLRQDFRTFDFLSPWEGAAGELPGDGKAPGEAGGAGN